MAYRSQFLIHSANPSVYFLLRPFTFSVIIDMLVLPSGILFYFIL